LESELAAAQNTLKARKQEDLTSVLDMFFERQGDPADFPIEAWNVFEPALLSRRYPWSDREILRRAEQVLQNRRERQKQERARQEQRLRKQRDQDDWLNTLSNPNSVALAEYLKRWPQGLHAEEAQQRIEHIKEDEAWQKVQQSSSMQDLCKFRKRFPKGRYASAVAEREAMLWRRIKRRKMTLEACLLGLALVLVLFAGKQALDQWRAWQERARQQRVHQEAVRQEQERARHEQVREEQAEKVRLRKEGEVAVASVKAGDTRVLDLGQGVTMELCGIPAGEFLMGSTKAAREWAAGPEGQGKAEWFTDEGEAPRLTRVSLSFWLGRTEATVGQWKRFVAENGYRTDAEKAGKAWCWDWDKNKWDWVKGRSWHDPNYGFGVRDEHPVSCVSWNDAMAFCKWMTESERAAGRLPNGLEYRLPTEAEWEYACRGGREGTRFWWGDSVAEGQGRLNAASDDKLGHKLPDATWSGKFPWSDGYAWASPVDAFGAKGRNGFGLADMLGNVWEWCLDGYDAKGAHEEAYRGDTSMRVLRGGSFNYAPGYVRCAHRDGDTPTLAYAYFGFRVVLGVVR
jgi:formylglycine-generating enzyme required for sulfatase activity